MVSGSTEGFRFVSDHQADYPIASMCRLRGVSSSGYYAWMKRRPSRRSETDAALIGEIRACEGPARQDAAPVNLGQWQFMVQLEGARLRLMETRRGVDLFVRRDVPGSRIKASWQMRGVIDLYRGLRAIERGQEVLSPRR